MALVICFAVDSLMFCPMTKKDPGTLNSSRMSRTFGVVESFGPSSKLNAISREGVLSTFVSSLLSGLAVARVEHAAMIRDRAMMRILVIVLKFRGVVNTTNLQILFDRATLLDMLYEPSRQRESAGSGHFLSGRQ